MKKNNKIILILVCVLMFIVPSVFYIVAPLILTNQYEESYLAELSVKYELLKSTDERKLVIVGGSNVAFGINSDLLSGYLGMKVINFGLYAQLGTKVMMDLSENYINEGDIVVLIPEIDPQSYSLYFGANAMLQALESNKKMLIDVKTENLLDLIVNNSDHVAQKYRLYRNNVSTEQGVYSKNSFNEYGDIEYNREYNIMQNLVDVANMVSINSEIIDADFIEYVNKYNKNISKKGAKLYFSFSPVNSKGLTESTTTETIYEFYEKLFNELDCPIISNPIDTILNPYYFYDTNFHLNATGAVLRTQILITDLYRIQHNSYGLDFTQPQAPIPPMDSDSTNDGLNDDTSIDYNDIFEYDIVDGYIRINGIKANHLGETSLVIPAYINEIKVGYLSASAFSSCLNLSSLTINNGRITIADDVFNGCKSLNTIILKEKDPTKVIIGSYLLRGANSKLKIMVENDSFAAYISDYYWANYSSNIYTVG